ncbi:MAG: AMP nucleosidase [Alphaproteobacteria bacterium]|nr:AMP nucleosidase [Alphaproteobacteria bacterium]
MTTGHKIPTPIKDSLLTTKSFRDAEGALNWVGEIYNANVEYLIYAFHEFSKEGLTDWLAHAHYPYIEVTTKKAPFVDNRLSFGFLSRPGTYRTTLTRPDLFRAYYLEQFSLILKNHPESDLRVGVSNIPIPLHFALGENFHLECDLSTEQLITLPEIFDQPDLKIMDDMIPNGTNVRKEGEPKPLALFTAPRVDLSLQRLKHYTGTTSEHFQKFVMFTNYQFYVDEFVRIGQELMEPSDDAKIAKERSRYTSFVEPGNVITHNSNIPGCAVTEDTKPARLPQMPAYHLKRADGMGITLINIGIGPSNAKTITDHVAVLRSYTWLMLGHCAGLRNSQKLGDYVLAHGYVREDSVLDHAVPLWVPIPALSEIQIALERAVSKVTGLDDYEQKKIMRTGTVATVGDRNWELWEQSVPVKRLSQCRAIALDMESATIATNGFRFRVPYGTLLCVSDKPLHGQLKLPGMADKFYRERVDQHLEIGMTALEAIRVLGYGRVHSRKLRSFSEVAFQ